MDAHSDSPKEIAALLLDFADSLLGAGAQTSRVLRNVCRLAESFGYEARLLVLPRTLTMTLLRGNGVDGTSPVAVPADFEPITVVRKTRPAALNFRVLSELRILTWEVFKKNLSPAECRSRYEKILRDTPRFSGVRLWAFVALANASFCYLLGGYQLPNGGLRSSLVVFAGTFLGFFVRAQLTKWRVNPLIVFVLSAFVASFIAGTCARGLQFHTDLAVSTSVLFLVPGVPLLNGVIDMAEGHVLAGFSRLVNASCLVLAMTAGLILTVVLLGSKTLL